MCIISCDYAHCGYPVISMLFMCLDSTCPSPTAGMDYTGVMRTLTFDETTSEITVAIEILGDNVLEDDKETFFVQLSSSDNAALFGIGRATKEICDDDTGECSLSRLAVLCL